MHLSPADMVGIVEILNRLYLDILAIEEAHGLRFGQGDFRPRIEHFHDAVRAFTAQTSVDAAPGGRLSLEQLAYDVAALRYIQAMPLSPLHREDALSPHAHLMGEDMSVPATSRRPDRAAKLQLAELYQQYGVLFSALFKPCADTDHRERVEAGHETIEQIAAVLHAIQHNAPAAFLHDAIVHLDDASLRTLLDETVKKGDTAKALAALKAARARLERQIRKLDETHLRYASAQLGLFEQGSDIVKKLAERGMNLAGRFVEASVAQSRREIGRS